MQDATNKEHFSFFFGTESFVQLVLRKVNAFVCVCGGGDVVIQALL